MKIFGLLAASVLAASDYSVISSTNSNIGLPLGELQMTDTVLQKGTETLNRFTMHRLRRPNIPSRGPILLLPALGNNFGGYLTHESGDVTKSFAAYFARLGYDVFGISPRETGIVSGACAAGLDCTPALQWNMGTLVEDIGAVRERIRSLYPARKPVLGGLSLGAATAAAVVNKNPDDYAGLIAWDGSPVTDNAAIRAHNLNFCNQFSGAVAGGVAVEDQSLPFVKLVAQMATIAPNALFAIPAPGIPPGLTNKQVLIFILSTPNPFAPSPRPGFITAAGDVPSATLAFSNIARLTTNIAKFNDATANGVTRDLHCALAGVDTTHTYNLKQFKAPLLVIKAGFGFGPIMDELPGKVGSTSVRMLQAPAFGHVDHLGSPNHLFVLEFPIAQWLAGVL